MAAYAALVSLMHIIKQLQQHPRPPISLDRQQADSLTDNVTFLQGFLEGYSSGGSKEEEELESRIANAAYEAEDIIESYTVDQIHEYIISDYFRRQCLLNVLERMDDIKRELDRIKRLDKQSEDHPRRPQFSVGGREVDSITENITFLRCFLEDYCSGGSKEELESRIADAAYSAEDVIESSEVDQIHAGSTSGSNRCGFYLCNCNARHANLYRVEKHMNNIRMEVTALMEIIKQKKGDHPHPSISVDDRQVDSITKDITLLQNFLQGCSIRGSTEGEELDSRIADAASAAEHIIKIHEDIRSSVNLYDHRLRDVMAHMGDIKSEIKWIEKLREYYPRRRISLQKKQVDYITENITFLQRFLEDHSSGGSKEEGLESRIADAAYAAEENVIESHEVDQIHAGSTSHGENISFVDWNYNTLKKDLHRVVERMYYIRGEVTVLMEIIKQKKGDHRHPPISLDKRQVDSITEDITFLQHFLEGYSSSSSKGVELESRVADAAYVAEDNIESHIVDQIHVASTSHGEKLSSLDFYQCLWKVIQDMDLIKKQVEIIKEKTEAQDELHRNSSTSTGSVRSASMVQNSIMVDFGDIRNEVLDKLTGQQDDLQILPIVGMGGIGKTTLARNIYEDSLVVQHFDVLAWVNISQEYGGREILLQVLCDKNKWRTDSFNVMSEDELGEIVYKRLSGRRYLIVMDDIWSIEVWNKVKFFFPDEKSRSRIMITTRLSNLASQLSCHGLRMKFLDKDRSWNLLYKIVFGKEECPIKFEKIGRKIAKSCRGLPLSIIVIGGNLKKSERTRRCWHHALENLNSLTNLENDDHCLQILHASYKELPMHLKPCFLYMGVFPKDDEINVSELIKLWVAEGFLKPIDGKSLEVVAEEYFKELIGRNLILVHKCSWNGEVAICKIHDRLRDLCLMKAQKQKFLCVLRQQQRNIRQGTDIERRICIHNNKPEAYSPQILHALESASLTRSLLLMGGVHEHSPPFSSRLLRVYTRVGKSSNLVRDSTSLEAILQQVNLRYLSIGVDFYSFSKFPSSFSLLWNLQTIKFVGNYYSVPFEIWKMPQLRHVLFGGLELPYPSNQEEFVLENLQTLTRVFDFKCSEEVVKRIPNIKKLKLCYLGFAEEESPNYCLNNLGHLHKLESLELKLCFDVNLDFGPDILRSHLKKDLTFPHSLKKLTLNSTKLHWEDLTTKIGSFPLLEVLKLDMGACIGHKWKTVEGQFCSLKFLLIARVDLKYWTTECSHFPRLEHLVLQCLRLLKEIPSSIGHIPTLQSIQLYDCRNSAANSAVRIKQEQEELGNEGLKVQILKKQRPYEEEEDSEIGEEAVEAGGVAEVFGGQRIYNGLLQIWMAIKRRSSQCFLIAQ